MTDAVEHASDPARLQLLVDAVADYAIYMLEPDGRVATWNPGAQRIKGYRPDEIIGQHFSRFFTQEDRARGLPERILSTAATKDRYDDEGWRMRKDGSRFWATAVLQAIRGPNRELIGFAKITRDITEQRQVQQALLASERRFRLLVESVIDYAIYMLDPNGLVVNWNAGAARIKGYAASEIVGHHFSDFYSEEDRLAGVPGRGLEVARREGRHEAEGWRVRKDGTKFWASVVIDAIRDDTGKLIGFAKITRDITERREAQEALRQAQKMEALGQLTGGVAHDFNNLLMIVSGHARTLKKLVGDHPRGARSVAAIEHAAKRGESLTRQLLTFSRRQRLNAERVHLGKAMETFGSVLSNSLGPHVQLVTAIGPELPPIEVDVSELELALVNLVVNARDAVAGRGVITISAFEKTVRRGSLPRPELEGDFVAISVADTGAGIPPDVMPKIFDPFFTTKPPDRGTGLGLSQVYGFVMESGGTVVVDSRVGEGTEVQLYLPVACAAAEPQREAAAPAADPAPGLKVLLVEDNREVAVVSADLLEQLGYNVHVVHDAGAALSAVEQASFDLVLSDIVMPGDLDGLGLAGELRRRQPHLPVLLATGYSRAADAAGRDFPILRKPYQIEDLSRAAAQLIAAAQQRATRGGAEGERAN